MLEFAVAVLKANVLFRSSTADALELLSSAIAPPYSAVLSLNNEL